VYGKVVSLSRRRSEKPAEGVYVVRAIAESSTRSRLVGPGAHTATGPGWKAISKSYGQWILADVVARLVQFCR